MRFFSSSSLLEARKQLVQTNYFKPLTSPIPCDFTEKSQRKHVILRKEIKAPIFPMSDGSGPTPSLSMSFNDRKTRTGLIGIKQGMTTMWNAFGARLPITVVKIQDNQVISTRFQNGAWRTQIGAVNLAPYKKLSRALLFYYRRWRVQPKREISEFKISEDAAIPSGVVLNAAHFVPGQFVDVQGTSRGKGFQGAMKRWHFKGDPGSHGNSRNHRTLGSTGQSTTPGKVHKGKKMPGNMGNEKKTVKALQVYKIDPRENLIYIAGPIPGAAGSFVKLRDSLFLIETGKCFPEGVKVPFPTFLDNPEHLPREMLLPGPTSRQKELDPFLIQRREKTG